MNSLALLPWITVFLGQGSFDDRASMIQKLGIKTFRPGADPNRQDTFDEARANIYKESMPEVLLLKNGTRITRAAQWPKRRAELVADFEREVYGRIPRQVPKVTWEVMSVIPGEMAGVPTVTKSLIGRVDNGSYTSLEVNIQATYTVPAHSSSKVPVMIEFGGFRPRTYEGRTWQELAISRGWGYGSIIPGSIQPDNSRLDTGIIGLSNKGRPRNPDDWGALRAWGWGVSRLIDYFESDRDSRVDPKKVGIAGVSRYGKAALVAEAFDPRVAVGLIASSGEGGSKLHRHVFGEAVENLAGGYFYWMAGNFMRYAAEEPRKTPADLPVDSHELIALCAPRPCFISHGVVEKGDAKWIDARGSFMAGVLAGPVYRLLGKSDLGTAGDYLTDPMPPVGKLIGGELAWRQHEGGHEITPNWPAFFDWVSAYIKAPRGTQDATPYRVPAYEPTPRTDANSQAAHQQLLEKRKRGRIDLYFVGDSITRRWGTSDPQYREFLFNWNQNFFGWNAANFGWGGDGTQHILWRLKNGELDGIKPKAIVILAGTNNLGSSTASEIAKGIKAIIETCRAKVPEAKVLLLGILPRNDKPGLWPDIVRVNREIRQIGNRDKVRFIELGPVVADRNGKLYEGMTVDGLHLAAKGYQVWADALKPHLTEILGPPGKTDQAPAPTGDPGIKG